MSNALILTCDQLPLPPLNGTSKKVHDLLAGIAGDMPVHAIVYPEDETRVAALRDYWRGRVVFHPLRRRVFARHARGIVQMCSQPTATRDFAGEAAIVRHLLPSMPAARLVIDFISGAPLVRAFERGVVVSGHDCMSHLFREESRRAATWREQAHFEMRRLYALRAERRYYRRAEVVHVVSDQDARALARIDRAIRTKVIPIASEIPSEDRLAPVPGRRLRLIWGNLGSPVILQGLRELLASAARRRPAPLRGWTLLGRVPAVEAAQRLPELSASGLNYLESVPNVSELLGRAALVLLPDLGGTGQKNRTLDALAHGCCVVGQPEVFRGLEGHGPFVQADTCDGIIDFVETGSP
jgi:hypothetical protein